MLLKHVRLLLGPLALSLGSFGVACTSCSDSTQVAADAGAPVADARIRDATQREAESEVPDTGVSDWSWLQGEWDALPAPYDVCPMRIAKDPKNVGISTRWKACSSGRLGCLELDQYWTTIKGRKVMSTSQDPVMVVDGVGQPVLLYGQMIPENQPPNYFVSKAIFLATTLTGEVLFAQALDAKRATDCVSSLSTGNAGLASATFMFAHGRSLAMHWNLASMGGTTVDIQTPFAGIAATLQGGGPSVLMKESEGAVGRWFQLTLASGAARAPVELQQLDGPRPVRTGFISRYFEAGFPVVHLQHDGTLSKLVLPNAGVNVTGYAADHTNAERLVWVEAQGIAPSSNPVLYTAPWANSQATLVKQRLTVYDDPGGFGGGYMIAANGHALLTTSLTTALLVRLSDGAHWTLRADAGSGWSTPMWVDDNEVWFVGAPLEANGLSFTDESNFYRIRRDTFGAPSPAR